jgi:hypothetical protein
MNAVTRAIFSPERWVLLSACDWHPDGSGYPTNLAALAAEHTDSDEC